MKSLQRVLTEELSKRQSFNARYSMRAFASSLGLSSGALSGIIRGQRNVGAKVFKQILSRLDLSPDCRQELLESFYGTPHSKTELKELSLEEFKLIAEWEHYAVLSLSETQGFKASPAYVARRLGIDQTKARQVLERLLELELVEKTDNGLKRSSQSLITSHDVPSAAIRKAHQDSLRQASIALERLPVEEREFGSLCFAIAKEDFPAVKEKIRKTLREILELSKQDNKHKDSVYRLSLQCFPLSKQKEPLK